MIAAFLLAVATTSPSPTSDEFDIDVEAKTRAAAEAAADVAFKEIQEMTEREEISDARLELCRESTGQDRYPDNVFDAVDRDPALGPITDVMAICQAYLTGRIDQINAVRWRASRLRGLCWAQLLTRARNQFSGGRVFAGRRSR